MKRIFGLLLIIMMIVLMVACNGATNNSIVGKWYNDGGKCLDIRSDNSWELEGSYGTGTWKLLDDKVTYEFTDVYGDTQKSKINEDELGQYIDFGYYGYFYYENAVSVNNHIANDNLETSTDATIDEQQYPIDKVYCYSDGLAWVQYSIATEKKYALVDFSGKELYSFSADYADINVMKGGISSFKARKGDSTNYYLINYEGKIIASSENDDFDNILAYEDGLALLYKYEGGIQSSKHLYGVMDKNGNWIQNYRDLQCNPYTDNQYYSHKYIGEGIFAIDMESNGDYLLFNSHNGNIIYLYNSEKETPSFRFVNGCAAILFDSGWVDPIVSDVPLKSTYDAEEIDMPFLLKTDGTYELLENFNISKDSVSGGMIIRDKGDFLDLYDYKSKNHYKITKYTQLGTTVTFYDDYGVHVTVGQDNNKYFTIVNRDGTSRFEPICGNAKYYSSGYIAYNKDDLWYICDQNGVSIVDALYKVENLKDGVIEVKLSKDASSVYWNLSGEQILTTVYISQTEV